MEIVDERRQFDSVLTPASRERPLGFCTPRGSMRLSANNGLCEKLKKMAGTRGTLQCPTYCVGRIFRCTFAIVRVSRD